ncbi:MAG TPA: hypothetical protein VMO47_10790 [Rhodothermales bacterium]|nr:hypothetical protein [Rhodothermales bacterium]
MMERLLFCLVLCTCIGVPSAEAQRHEVWLIDQSNSPGKAFGGTIYIFDGASLAGGAAPGAAAEMIDLADEAATLCVAETGANPVRPHMLMFNATETHAILSFVASGHVVLFDAAAREPVGCVRTSIGAGGARQAHAAFPSPDDSYILVANQNGKLLERIDTDYATNTFAFDPSATLDLALCFTPNAIPCEGPGIRPDNAPICPVIDGTGDLGFITLRGGGLFVVNPRTNPMSILAEYDHAAVHGNGCGGAMAGGSLFIDSGGGTAANLHEFDVYRFPLTGYSGLNPPNVPAPLVVYSDDGAGRDAHGMVVTKHGQYLWVFDRGGNLAEVFDVATNARLQPVELAGAVSADPAPDLGDIAPAGNRLYMSLRGPTPLTGDPHVATGSTPGLGVIQLDHGGKGGSLKSLVRISNIDAAGIERADAHGVRVRRK